MHRGSTKVYDRQMRASKLLPLALLALATLTTACDNGKKEAYAREVLEKQGLEDIELTEREGGFTFTAKQGAQTCKGEMDVEISGNKKTHRHSMTCQ
jgi:hypothetical protein